MSEIPDHCSIRILLINTKQELLLMCADDPSTTSKDGTYNGRFWFTIGGQIEPEETLLQAATRELFEETGLKKTDVSFGPVVWFGEFELILSGVLTRLKQQFIVAKTHNTTISTENLTESEKKVVKQCEWFSLDKIQNSHEIIYPMTLQDHLPNILQDNYPSEPLEISLD